MGCRHLRQRLDLLLHNAGLKHSADEGMAVIQGMAISEPLEKSMLAFWIHWPPLLVSSGLRHDLETVRNCTAGGSRVGTEL